MSTTNFPIGGRSIVEHMVAKFPSEFVNVDEIQRGLTTKIAEQFAAVYGTHWGCKKRAALPDSFKSKDSLAVREGNGTTSVWDLFSADLKILVNDGDAPKPTTHANLPDSQATFMPVTPHNWLGVQPEEPDPDPLEPDPDATGDDALLKYLENLEEQLEDIKANQHMTAQEVSNMRNELVGAINQMREEVVTAIKNIKVRFFANKPGTDILDPEDK